MIENVREYIDRLHVDGHTVGEDQDDDPVLIDPSGQAVDAGGKHVLLFEAATRPARAARSSGSWST